jgi:tetrahydromethanopterin S-methyltransferase subunit G
MPLLKVTNFESSIVELKSSIELLPDILEKMELNIDKVKKLSSFFNLHKQEMEQLDNSVNHSLLLLQSRLKNDTLSCLTEEANKLGKVILDKSQVEEKDKKLEELQKNIDSKVEFESNKLQQKFNDDLENKMTICKILSEKEKNELQSMIKIKDFELSYVKLLNDKLNDDKNVCKINV